MIARFQWQDARTVEEAIAQLDDKTMIKAGGIDLMDRLKERLDSPAKLINIRTIPGLDQIRDEAAGLQVGPMVTLDRLANDKTVRAGYLALADAAGFAATPHIRNVATVGGNILQRPRCWYFRSEQFHCLRKGGDRCFAQDGENEYHAIFDNQLCAIVHPSAVAVALVALGASIELTGPRGRREITLEQFFIRPEEDVKRENRIAADELLTGISVPKLPAGSRSAYTKLGEKESFDWPIAEVAVVLGPKPAVVLGAAAPIPWRAMAAERILAGRPTIDEETARAAARAAVQDARPLSSNAYKLPVFETVIRRTILAAAKA
jgi:xanthine dehydrogenase YagS FAD-binding subunit